MRGHLRVMTFNIWNYTPPWPLRRKLIAEVIRAHDPDVVALQEVRHDFRHERGVGQAEQIAAWTSYHVTSAIAQVYIPLARVDEGLALLTREPPRDVAVSSLTLSPRDRRDENHRIVLGAAVDVSGSPVHVFSAHFSLSPDARVINAAETLRFVRARSGEDPAVLMGDLNALPDSPPLRLLTGTEEIAGERGDLTDCWRAVYPGRPGYTYPSHGPVRRIDYVLARNLSAPAAAQLAGRQASDGVYPSDHLALLVDLPV